jgi:hypothetical protein
MPNTKNGNILGDAMNHYQKIYLNIKLLRMETLVAHKPREKE